jgi:hypothetical protein
MVIGQAHRRAKFNNLNQLGATVVRVLLHLPLIWIAAASLRPESCI